MGDPAKQLAPLQHQLLTQALSAEAPDLESSDERLEKVNGLVSKGDYVEADEEVATIETDKVSPSPPYILQTVNDGLRRLT